MLAATGKPPTADSVRAFIRACTYWAAQQGIQVDDPTLLDVDRWVGLQEEMATAYDNELNRIEAAAAKADVPIRRGRRKMPVLTPGGGAELQLESRRPTRPRWLKVALVSTGLYLIVNFGLYIVAPGLIPPKVRSDLEHFDRLDTMRHQLEPLLYAPGVVVAALALYWWFGEAERRLWWSIATTVFIIGASLVTPVTFSMLHASVAVVVLAVVVRHRRGIRWRIVQGIGAVAAVALLGGLVVTVVGHWQTPSSPLKAVQRTVVGRMLGGLKRYEFEQGNWRTSALLIGEDEQQSWILIGGFPPTRAQIPRSTSREECRYDGGWPGQSPADLLVEDRTECKPSGWRYSPPN
jgi:hypothetical protein